MKSIGLAFFILAVSASALLAQSLPARRSSNYEPNSRSGRFDLRVRVDGSADLYIRGDQIRYRLRHGAPPSDEGSEYRQEIPRGPVYGLNLDQRDGRNPIRIVEEPSPRNNWTLMLSIDDPQGGADRYHARITWDDSAQASPFGRGPSRFPGRGDDDDRRRDHDRHGDDWYRDNHRREGVPDWAVGTFRATDRDLILMIQPDGDALLQDRGQRVNGRLRNGRMRLGSLEFHIDRDRSGIVVTESGNHRNRTRYRRIH